MFNVSLVLGNSPESIVSDSPPNQSTRVYQPGVDIAWRKVFLAMASTETCFCHFYHIVTKLPFCAAIHMSCRLNSWSCNACLHVVETAHSIIGVEAYSINSETSGNNVVKMWKLDAFKNQLGVFFHITGGTGPSKPLWLTFSCPKHFSLPISIA